MSTIDRTAVAENPWLSRTATIEDITPELPGVATYRLRLVDVDSQARYHYEPGQFNMLYLPGVGEIAISVSAGTDASGTWDHTVRLAGNVTRTLAGLDRGATLGLRGPYGSSWPMAASEGADLLLVAGGIGLAPLRQLIYEIRRAPARFGRCTLLYGSRSPDTLLYDREYADWSSRGIDVQTTVDRAPSGWHGNVGVVPLLIDRLHFLSPNNSVLMTCGPEVMMRYAIRSALARGLPKARIWVSLERNMQCAVGLCGHCQLGPAFVCKDGPVFRFDKIEPFLRVNAL